MLEQTELEPMLAAIVRSSLDCIIAIDEAGRVLEFNPSAERVFGFDRMETLGRPIADLIVPHHLREAHEKGLARYAAGGVPVLAGGRVETEGLRKDGTTFPVELTITEVYAPGRRVFTASLRDLSESTQRARELASARRSLELAAAGAKLGIWSLELGKRRAWFSERSLEIFGLAPDTVIDEALLRRLIHPEDWARASEPFYRGFPDDLLESEYRITRADGERRWVYALGTAIRDETGIARTVHGIHLDITPRKKAEAELAESREALHQSEKLSAMGSLLAGVSHELNNPLSAIVGQSEILEEDSRGTVLEERARKIRIAAARCARIVQTFLAMARRKPAQRTLVDLNALVEGALELAEYGLRTAGIAVERSLEPALPPVEADRDQLIQVLVNLIVNAQQAMERAAAGPKTLRLRTSEAAGEVRIDVIDSGAGVPEAVRGRIFDPFFTTKPEGSGTGVGLSFSQGIVESHGGRLTLEPSDAGAWFRIAVPAAAGERVAAAPVASAPILIDDKKCRVLLVEDEPDVGETLGEIIEREGFEVTLVGDGDAAVALLDQAEFDLVLSDLRMPGMGGRDLHAHIERHRPHLLPRMAFITGDTLGATMAAFLQSSGRPVLEKPFTRADVRALLQALGSEGLPPVRVATPAGRDGASRS